MPREQWEANTKAIIVIQGLPGQPVAVLCNASQMSQ
jgi:hypothetical protein